jgi:amino acid adenylation domain-containing protein
MKNPTPAIPLLSIQKRFWIVSKLYPDDTSNIVPFGVKIRGKLDKKRLYRAIQNIVQAHVFLRAKFIEEQNDVFIKIQSEPRFDFTTCEIHIDDENELETTLLSECESIINRPYDLTADNMLRCKLILIKEDEAVLCCALHHIVCDGWSIEIFLKHLVASYFHLPNLSISNEEELLQKASLIHQRELNEPINYWLDKLRHQEFVSNFPLDKIRQAEQSFRGTNEVFEIPEELTNKINRCAKSHNITTFTLMLTAYQLLIYYYTRNVNIIIGVPFAYRKEWNLTNEIGVFINTIAFAQQLPVNGTFRQALQAVWETLLEARNQTYCPFEKLVDALNIKRDLAVSPLFQMMFVYQTPYNNPETMEGLSFEHYFINSPTAKLDLILDVLPLNQTFQLRWNYCTDLFSQKTIRQLIRHYMQCLKLIIDRPDAIIESQSPLTASEIEQQLCLWNSPSKTYLSGHETIHTLFVKQATATPLQTAIVYLNKEYTFQDIEIQSNQLAHYLLTHNLGPKAIVPVMMDCSEKYVIALLAILKINGLFLPIDKVTPVNKIKQMLAHTGAPICITDDTIITSDLTVVSIDYANAMIKAAHLPVTFELLNTFEDAYVICTSGTTHLPKAVIGNHKATLNRFYWMWEKYPFHQDEKCCVRSSIGFVDSIWELFGPLLKGITIYIVPAELKRSVESINRFLIANNIARLLVVPALLDAFNLLWSISRQNIPKSLRMITSSGEELHQQTANTTLQIMPYILLLNIYGSAEVAADATYHEVTRDDSKDLVPIGKPISNVKAYVLDAQLGLIPPGVTGTIYIGGDGLSSGYLNSPDLQQQRFLSNPFIPNAMIYYTGDRGKWTQEGVLEYHGREESYVKINGIGISLREIDFAIMQNSCVIKSYTCKHNDDHQAYLVSFIVIASSCSVEQGEHIIREHLSAALPHYMHPARFIFVDDMMYSTNGKVNYREMIKIFVTKPLETVSTTDSLLQKLIQLWRQFFNLNTVNENANFFSLGGNSLSALRLTALINTTFCVELETLDLFKNPTVLDYANCLRRFQKNCVLPELEPVIDKSPLPVTAMQRALCFYESVSNNETAYNSGFYATLHGKLDEEKFKAAVKNTILLHDALRTTYEQIENDVYLKIHDTVNIETVYQKYTYLDRLPDAVIPEAKWIIAKPFILNQAVPIRIVLYELKDDMYLILFSIHHIAVDGISFNKLLKDIGEFYNTGKCEAVPLLQYSHYAHWYQQVSQSPLMNNHVDFFVEKVKHLVSLKLPYQQEIKRQEPNLSNKVKRTLSKRLVGEIKSVCQSLSITYYIYSISILYVLLYRITGQKNLFVATPYHNRHTPNLINSVGCFFNTLLLIPELNPETNFREWLNSISSAFHDMQQHHLAPLAAILSRSGNREQIIKHDTLQCLFAFEEQAISLQLQDLDYRFFEVYSTHTKVDLLFTLVEDVLIVEYNTRLFHIDTINSITDAYCQIFENGYLALDKSVIDFGIVPPNQLELMQDLYHEHKLRNVSLYSWFHQSAMNNVDKIAITAEQESISYSQLLNRVDQIAGVLISAGVKAGDCIALYMETSIITISAILAVTKCHAIFVPINTDLPKEKVQYILSDSSAQIILTTMNYRVQLESMPINAVTILLLDSISSVPVSPPCAYQPAPQRIAYILYTSGTTGNPCGVMSYESALINILEAYIDRIGLDSRYHFISMTNYAFDIFLMELFVPLLLGSHLTLLNHKQRFDVQYINTLFQQFEYKCMQATPTLWNILISEGLLPQNHLKLIAAGEALPATTAERLFLISTEVYDCYGPTETTVYSTIAKINHANKNIGKPIYNTRVFIADTNDKPLPFGITGQILIAGMGVAKGYLNLPMRTLEKFVPLDTVFGNQVYYKTGDYGYFTAKGDLVYLNRMDRQVKRHGNRIELNEIEAAFLANSAILQAAAVLHQDQLYAFVTVAEEKSINTEMIYAHLGNLLAPSQLPKDIILLQDMPHNSNGKLCYKSLLQKLPIQTATHPVIAIHQRENIETELTQIWCRLLRIPNLNTEKTFFEHGSHSLLAVRLKDEIEKHFPVTISLTELFSHATLALQVQLLLDRLQSKKPLFQTVVNKKIDNYDDIAVIGMACRFPRSNTLAEYWQNLLAQQDLLTTFPYPAHLESIREDKFVNRCGVIDTIDLFDAEFFGINDHEAMLMDPHHRLFLEIAWSALENSGNIPNHFDGRIGIIAGMGYSHFATHQGNSNQHALHAKDYSSYLGNAPDFLVTRIAYKLNLTGPAFSLHTACSTSLVAIVKAIQSLHLKEADIMLAGGISLNSSTQKGYWYQAGNILSPDGFCKSYDSLANGTVPSSGGGIVVLKRLADAIKDRDFIYAIIKGGAINNDGKVKASFTAPSKPGQIQCIRSAITNARIDPRSVSIIEGHGSGTKIGDTMELEALSNVYQNCYVNSVKSNIGHTDTAAGVAGFIKACLLLNNKILPGAVNFFKSNEYLSKSSSLIVNSHNQNLDKLSSYPRRVGVNSLGMGGTNAHVILEEK